LSTKWPSSNENVQNVRTYGKQHASVFLDGSTASEERHDEYDASDDHDENGEL